MSSVATLNSDRVRFVIDGLDDVLHGGVPRHNTVLLEGPAGAGKTALALAFLYAGAVEHAEPGLFISFELSPDKLLRDAKSFGWDLQPLLRKGLIKVLETTPEIFLRDLRVRHGALIGELQALGVKRLVIDGLTPLRSAYERTVAPASSASYRSHLQQQLHGLARLGVTTLATTESDGLTDARLTDERYVFDTLISLERSLARPGRRTLEVIKSRGQDFVGGRHTLRLESGRGVQVYPRAQSRQRTLERFTALGTTEAAQTPELHGFGSPDLDALFGGGLYPGSITLVSGVAGTGKTVAGLQFLAAGAMQGQAGLFVSLDEPAPQLIRNAKTLDYPVESWVEHGQLTFLYESPLELELDVHFDRILRVLEQRNVSRVVFDSLARYEKAHAEDLIGFLYAVAALCRARGASAVFNYESAELRGSSQLSEIWKGSQLVDNIVLLSYAEISAQLRRAIAVPKARGRRIAAQTREYVIGDSGLALLAAATTRGVEHTALGAGAPQSSTFSPSSPPSSSWPPASVDYGLLTRDALSASPSAVQMLGHIPGAGVHLDVAIGTGQPVAESALSSSARDEM